MRDNNVFNALTTFFRLWLENDSGHRRLNASLKKMSDETILFIPSNGMEECIFGDAI